MRKIIDLILPSILDWVGGKLNKMIKKIIASSKIKNIKERKGKRDEIIRQIEEAQKRNDHQELEKLYTALHLLDIE